MTAFSDFMRPSSLSIDTRTQKLFEEDDSSILDDGILDSSLESDIFSPQPAEWGDFSDHDATVAALPSTNPFFGKNNPFAYKQPQQDAWGSGACTPTAVYDSVSTDVVGNSAVTSASVMAANSITADSIAFGNHTATSDQQHFKNSPSAPSTVPSMPASPQLAARDWEYSSTIDPYDRRSIPRRMRPGSPLGIHSPIMRRDGIRKKNARFEIPAERNLTNIDQLIAQSANEQEIKELKQQKRLLRNRQAALDSRQRKKQHTERLEEEKKQYTNLIGDLEDQLNEMKLCENEWKNTQMRYEQYIQSLQLEKEEMVRRHTLETGDLRKKNAILTDHIQRMESTPMSAAPSSSAFSTDFSEMDGIAMEDGSWDNFGFLNDFNVDPDTKNNALIMPRKAGKAAFEETDKPATSGLLLVLLLCGAFVASKSSTTSTPTIPRMPDDIRAASATVLDNIFKDAGVHQADPRFSTVSRVDQYEPGPSGSAWTDAKANLPSNLVGISGSSLDVLNHQLVQPTKEQEQEQLFSLSAEQYNGVTSQEFLREPAPPSASQGRRNLGASLAAMRDHQKGSIAEVYTRSLLWDKVPAEVVREFAKFVADSNNARSQETSHDE